MFSKTAALATFFAALQYVDAQSVVAHFMAQNSYEYTQEDWVNDIATAQSIGIEGFALNIAAKDYEFDRLPDAYAAAEAAGFKLFYSFDLNYDWNDADIIEVILSHVDSPATYLWNDAVLVSTFSGSAKGNDFWNNIKTQLSNQGVNIVFAPAFIDYVESSQAEQLASTFPSIDGFLNWWAWPHDNGELVTADADLAFQSAVADRSGPYIMSVSPWQFKNLGTSDTSWVQLSDTLWNYRWLQAVNDVKPDIVEIVTWNDYGESHYIGEINPKVDLGDQAPHYVNGFVHTAWRNVAAYYIQWYKNGAAPEITDDSIVYWYRVHPKGATCSGGFVPRNTEYVADAVFGVAILSSDATITLDIGSSHNEVQASAGVTVVSVDFPPEDSQTPSFAIVRDGQTMKSGEGPRSVEKSCDFYNFNPIVGVVE